jgi:hypothetical protein
MDSYDETRWIRCIMARRYMQDIAPRLSGDSDIVCATGERSWTRASLREIGK